MDYDNLNESYILCDSWDKIPLIFTRDGILELFHKNVHLKVDDIELVLNVKGIEKIDKIYIFHLNLYFLYSSLYLKLNFEGILIDTIKPL